MLAGVGRWLRIAGYDTKIIEESIDDRLILECAIKEKRLLLTRDRHFVSMKEDKIVVYLKGNSVEDCIKELNEKLQINWLYKPFSRCLVCNTLLSVPDEKIIQEQAPPDIQHNSNRICFCERCQKVYWDGSHTKHMLEQLKAFQK